MWQFLIPAATAIMGARTAERKADNQRRYNLGQAETTRYSPWTGVTGKLDSSYTPGMLEGGLSGGLQGLSIAQGLGGMSGGDPTPSPMAGDPMSAPMGGGSAWDSVQQPGLYGGQSNPFAYA